jgi:hypothetical protein
MEETGYLLRIITTGEPAHLERMLPLLIGQKAFVEGLTWRSGKLVSH